MYAEERLAYVKFLRNRTITHTAPFTCTALNVWYGTDKIGTRTIFISARPL
jgi:hypothetical protein